MIKSLIKWFRIAICVSFSFLFIPGVSSQRITSIQTPRLIVLTDISSLSQREGEPDDGQSLIRLMLYTNELNLEGLIATSNLGHGQRTRPELIRNVVDAYGELEKKLRLHDKNYPAADKLKAIIKQGTPYAGPLVSVDETIGEGKDTEGSDWIIKVVDKKDPRPVWISIWGGSADLAQALWKVKRTRSVGELNKFIAKLRIHAVYDQDKTGPWLKAGFPQLFYIFRHHGIRGMYRGGDTSLVRSAWVESNIRHHHGALGALYVNYQGGDVWSGQLGRVHGIKEGDTPSFLYLLQNGLNVPEHPDWGGWSGRFKKDKPLNNLWTEAVDSIADYATDPDPRMAALYRWRMAWQADFAARLDWCVQPYREANHHPVAIVNGIKTKDVIAITASPGAQVMLNAQASMDPDGDSLSFHWFVYEGVGSFSGEVPLSKPLERRIIFTVPQKARNHETIHLILEITDNGIPALYSYRRVVITVRT